jgi:hypothetical protein
MWIYLEALLAGRVGDPFLIGIGGLASFLMLLTVGAVIGFAWGAVVGRRSSSPFAGWLFSPWLAGVAVAAGMMLIGFLMSPGALSAASSWTASLTGGGGAALGWWVTFSAVGETAPVVPRRNPFQEGDQNPFGVKDADQGYFDVIDR